MKKLICIALVLLLCGSAPVFAAKITELTEDTAPTTDDLAVTVDDPGGSATNKKVTLANFGKGLTVTSMISACTDAQVLGGNAAGTGVECQADANTTYTAGDFITLTGTDFDVDVKDEDNMASNSATHLATQQSIKAYADTIDQKYDTDDELIAIINASPSTTIKHEAGGLEADVSAYNGFVKISGGTTSAVTAHAGTDISADLEEEVTEGSLADSVIVSADIKDGTIATGDIAADTITHANIADADQATTICGHYFESDGIDDADDIVSWWANKTAKDFLITELWCQTDTGTVTAMVQVDDGTPADIDGTDIVCDTDEQEDTSLDGDTTIAAGEEVDWAVTSTASTPTWVHFCITGNWVD